MVLTLVGNTAYSQCNGHQSLCDKRYNEVAYLTTHNAYNVEEDNFNLPNHTYGITRQLNDGVRALMLDVHDEGGEATVYHGFTWLGTTTLQSNFNEIKAFLDANPNEVVTLLFETYISANLMEQELTQAGLLPMLHVQQLGEPWPTLQEMINSGKRLVFFSDHNNGQAGQDWYHYMWSYAVETHFENNALSDFDCEFNRGNPNSDLFILNHFATDPTLGTGRTDLAEQANEFNYFYTRARQCEDEASKFPNFPTVDFYELGNSLEVVDSLNEIPNTLGIGEKTSENAVSVFPNPSSGRFNLTWNRPIKTLVRLFNSEGKLVFESQLSGTSVQLNLEEFSEGVYHAVVQTESNIETVKLIHLR